MQKRTEEKDLSTKEKIISEAFTLFAKKGIKDISMREIAASCGVTKPVIYYYFTDKDALCLEIVKHIIFLKEHKFEGFIEQSRTLKELLTKMFSSYLDSAMSKKIVGFMLHLYSYMSSRPELEAKFHETEGGAQEELEAFIDKEIEKGLINKDMKKIALHFIHANAAHMVINAFKPGIEFGPTYPQDLTKVILRGICYKGEID